MKVIDVLNMWANGETVKVIDEKGYFASSRKLLDNLNSEVEIIEDIPKEEKKIPEKLDKYAGVSGDLACKWTFGEKKLKDKINEILDYLKSKGE